MQKFIYTLLLVLAMPLMAMAQKDLCIGKVLDGRYRKHPAVTDVEITGERLKEYGLTYYHSFTVKGDARLMKEVVTAFTDDEAKAADKDLTNVGGQLYAGLYRMDFDGTANRFVFFKDMRWAPSKKQDAVILIYMEGYTSLKVLQKKFKK